MTTVDSASNDRIANNAVRHQYRVLTDREKQLMVEIKDLGAALLTKIAEVGATRETAIARTKTEEAVMWAVKSLTA